MGASATASSRIRPSQGTKQDARGATRPPGETKWPPFWRQAQGFDTSYRAFEVERCNVRIASDGLVEIIAAPCSKPRSQEINHVGMGRGNKGGRDHQSQNE